MTPEQQAIKDIITIAAQLVKWGAYPSPFGAYLGPEARKAAGRLEQWEAELDKENEL